MYKQINTNVSFIRKSLPYYKAKYTELQTRMIIAAHKEGYTGVQISRMLGISTATVYRVLSIYA